MGREQGIQEIIETLRYDIEELEEILEHAKEFANKIELIHESA